ncbi:MAG: DUF1538 domain-containing protein [Clostridia bacterium]|nr:DUF1538 domain-containing protein [Clostridia bacterium]
MKLLKTIKDTFISSLPLLAIIAICLCFFPLPSGAEYVKIIIGYISVVVGQAFFLTGLDSSIIPIGHMVGNSFSKYNKLFFVLTFGFAFGLLATVAEPALAVLARQVSGILPIINSTLFIWVTSFGIGVCVALALYRMLKNYSIKIVFAILYALVFLFVIFAPEEFISIAFDGSGATTGDVSVPFILALGIGISATFSKNKTNEDSFGIIGIASVGPIITVLLYGIIVKWINGGVIPEANDYVVESGNSLGAIVSSNLLDVALAVLPIVLISIPFLLFIIKLRKREFLRLILGVIPVYVGLLIFLSGIDYGFGYVGEYIGKVFFGDGKPNWLPYILLIVGFILGGAITISEPAVTVLGDQIEDLTNGHIRKNTIRLTLALGIGFASMLAILKILTQVNILYFLVPLYVIAVILMKFTPNLFVGLAFDSGGVTGGALTSAFLTPLTLSIAQQVALSSGGKMSVLANGFGIISFISVTPLIAVQLLGIIYNVYSKKANSSSEEENFEELQYFISNGNVTSTKTKRRKYGK